MDMARTWAEVPRGKSVKMIFNLDGRIVEAGAASSRCFRDLVDQRGDDRALDAVERAAGIRITSARFPDSVGTRQFDVVVESLLIGAGVPSAQVPTYASRYRQGRETGVDLRQFDFG
jgi:hypothetical protein